MIMFYRLTKEFIHHCTWSWDEIQHLLMCFKAFVLMIIHHNCICIKSIVIFLFMKFIIVGLSRKFKFRLWLKSFFLLFVVSIILNICILFCCGEYISGVA